jgi:hypothetical protein
MTTMKRLIILTIFVSTITPFISGQDVNVISSFDTSRIYIGDQIEYKVTVDQPSDLKLTFPLFKDTLC